MAEFPSMPLFTDAYLGDTTHLTTIEHGAYLLLLMTQWRSKDCRLPDDDKMLARYARCNPLEWESAREILAPFFLVKDGFWTQLRLLDEWNYVRQKREQNIMAGKVSALKRKGRHSTDVLTDVQPDPQHKRNQPTTPNPQPIEDDATRARFRKIYDEGSAVFPALATRHTEIINRWIEACADPDADVLPVMRRHAGKNITSWNYFTQAVMDAIATRTAPLPEGNPNAHQQNTSSRHGKSERAKAAILEGLGLSPEG